MTKGRRRKRRERGCILKVLLIVLTLTKMLCISIYSVSLRELCENEDDNVVLAFEQLSETFFEKHVQSKPSVNLQFPETTALPSDNCRGLTPVSHW